MGIRDVQQMFNRFFDGLEVRRQSDHQTEQMKLHSRIGEGSVHRIAPRADLGIAMADFTLNHDRQVNFRTELPMVELSYCLQGARMVHVPGAQYEVPPGSYTLQLANPAEARLHFPRDQAVQAVSIGIPVTTFHHFMEEVGGARSIDFHRVIGGQPFRMFHERIDPSTSILLAQLVQSATKPGVRNLEMEYRILELMSLGFRSFLLDGKPELTKLSRTDRAKIEHARDIMLRRMAEPPSLLELARLVGLNDHKLKVGFKEVYGNTVFGYLREQRLEKAFRLLQEGPASVIEVSYAVGYSNPSYFAEAFRKKYGINPGQLVRRR
ncbi:helix-turn-helix transcriptional regulator [Paenibacillus allorhizosphaerae]|uniref:HTH araC/xylS-type domain-containing protein n=1 Tax=Paenibacillus allorhizosphaerae TaxID=2849866 RepID=A0ABM8VJ38_9BACL|nr:AraC family transcriptional regulator [Paenibacillus allorhizosphaerae]CAG7645036.1 hypothetical protein PAECIP111802_03414 [Paenibacillus allorhizosphaerae]